MKKAWILISLLSLLALPGCADLLNASIPTEGYSVERDIPFGDNPRFKLNVYKPEKPAAGQPVLVFYYGGRWENGSKDDYLFVAQAFASKGITVVIPDYRLYPEVRYPTFVEDAAKALVWTHEHIGHYGGDKNNIFVAGHSAGAYIALMLASNNTYIKKAGGKPSWIRGAIGLAGPYNFKPSEEDKDIKDMFGTAKDADTQPISYVHKNMPPIFLATGDADKDVQTHNTYDLATKLGDKGNVVEVHTYPDVEHIGLVLALADGFRGKAPVLEDISGFIRKYEAGN